MAELSVMDRINMILSDPEKATMTLAQIVSEEIREFKASPEYAIMLEAESYYRNRSDVQRKTVDVANRSNTKIEHPILKKLVDQKANYLLSKPWTVDTKNSAYGEALTKVFDQTFRRKIKSLGKGAIKSGIAWIQPYFRDGKLAFMRIPSTELVPLWRDAERTELDAFIRFYDQVIYIGTRKHIITHAEFWWPGGVKWFKTDAFAGTGAGNFYVDKEHGDEASDYTEPHFVVDNKPYNWEECPIAWLKYNEEELPLCYYITLWRMLSAISASITVNFSAVFRPTLHKPTGRLTPPLPFGRKSVIRRKNGRPGPSRSAPMTLITAATKCPTTGNTGHLTLTRTSGSLASMAGRR